MVLFFFFQAEDGIRDYKVTGVQTCALPISVYIPKVYDGRNKTFWIANFDGWRIRRGNILQGLVPDPAQLNGDFSSAAATLPAFGTAACAAQLAQNLPCMPVDPNTGQPFAGNKMDPSSFSKLARETLSLKMFPAPNCDPAGCQGNNFKELVTLPTNMNQQTYKVDQDLGRYGRVFGRMTFAHYDTANLGSLTIPQGNNPFVETERSWMVSHTLNLGTRNVNNFRFGRLGATANQCGVP